MVSSLFFIVKLTPEAEPAMEKPPSTIRGLINDLARTLTASLVHLDDLLLRLDKDTDGFGEAWLTNQQLERALEFFIELRSEYIMQDNRQDNQRLLKTANSSLINTMMHKLNNDFTVAICKNDLLSIKNKSKDFNIKYESLYNTIIDTMTALFRIFYQNQYQPRKSYRTIKPEHHKIQLEKGYNRKILLVEDHKELRKIMASALELYGYMPLKCATGQEAVAKYEQEVNNILIHIIEFGLPDINGINLANIFIEQKPESNILYINGYNELKLKDVITLRHNHRILMKPFHLPQLLQKIQSIIHQ